MNAQVPLGFGAAQTRGAILLERAAYTVVAVVASTIVTALFSLLLNGAVLGSFIVTGMSCSLVVAWFLTAKAQALTAQASAASLREAALKAEAERLVLVRAVMREVNHHVNNLSNNLQLIDLEYSMTAKLKPETLTALKAAIGSTTQAIDSLNRAAESDPDQLVSASGRERT
jgi:hypothetical protein